MVIGIDPFRILPCSVAPAHELANRVVQTLTADFDIGLQEN